MNGGKGRNSRVYSLSSMVESGDNNQEGKCVINDFIWEYTGLRVSSAHEGSLINEAFGHSNKDLNPV